MPRRVVILGSTGSIGTQAIEVVRQEPHRFDVVGLAAGGGRLDLLADQACALDVQAVAVADASKPLNCATSSPHGAVPPKS